MIIEKSIVTKVGKQLFSKVHSGECKFEITKIAVGNGEYTHEEKNRLDLCTDLKSNKQNLKVTETPISTTEGNVKISTILNNKDTEEGFFLKEFGIFAVNPETEGGEILYAISIVEQDKAEYVPAKDSSSPLSMVIHTYLAVDNASDVVIQDNIYDYVAKGEFEEQTNELVNQKNEFNKLKENFGSHSSNLEIHFTSKEKEEVLDHVNNKTDHITSEERMKWNEKQDTLIIDSEVKNSTNLVQNKAVKNYIDGFGKELSVDGKNLRLVNANGEVINTVTTQDTVYSHPTTAGNKHIPTGGASGQILKYSSSGTAKWEAEKDTTYDLVTTDANGLMSIADKQKLNKIAAEANNYMHPTAHPASMIVEETDKQFMKEEEKTKLYGITANANNYTHPTTHPASIITEATNKRFMTDAERTKLSGITAGANNYSHPTGEGYNHIPRGGTAGEVLQCYTPGVVTWGNPLSSYLPVAGGSLYGELAITTKNAAEGTLFVYSYGASGAAVLQSKRTPESQPETMVGSYHVATDKWHSYVKTQNQSIQFYGFYGSTDHYYYMNFVTPSFYNGATNTASLGTAARRWTAVYASTGTIQTSDRNKKCCIEDIEEKYELMFKKIRPVTYKFKDGIRTHIGAISQDIEEIMEECKISSNDFAGFCKDEIYNYELDEEGNEIEDTKTLKTDEEGNPLYDYSLRYDEFIMLNVHMTKKLLKRVDELEKINIETERRIEKLESDISLLLSK